LNRRIKIIIITSASVVLLLSSFLAVYFTVISPPGLKEFDNIVIWNDSDFRDYKLEGKGTINEPYLIKDFIISTSVDKGIFIADTTKHFIIDGCVVEAPYASIYIQNTAANTVQISNNLIKNSRIGIFISNSDGIIISNNTCENIDGENGISIYHSEGMTLSNNTCNYVVGVNYYGGDAKNFGNGIFISNCPDSSITSNTISNNAAHGIYITSSPNCSIEQNSFIHNEITGLIVTDSAYSTIRDNEFVGPGLVFDDMYMRYTLHVIPVIPLEFYRSYKVEQNTVNGKPLGYFVDQVNLTINSDIHEQYIFINCTNLTVSNISITASTGVAFLYCDNLQLENTTVSYNAEFGISVFYSDNITAENNYCSYNDWGGIVSIHTNNSVIKNNSMYRNSKNGITSFLSHNNSIIENQCHFSTLYGIQIGWSTEMNVQRNIITESVLYGVITQFDTEVTIYNNTITNNSRGIWGYSSTSCNISRNVITNSFAGIELTGRQDLGFSEYCTITYNYIAESTLQGVLIYGGSYNKIHHNSFIYNNQGSHQGFDSGSSNTWYDDLLSEGNFWSDWISGPYTISGSAGAEDLYPLVAPPV
jgi:parallel beta-helix repeat protein